MSGALFLLAAIGAVLDVLTTCIALEQGARERNPRMRRLFARARPLLAMIGTHGSLLAIIWGCMPVMRTSSLVLIACFWWGAALWNFVGLVRQP